MKLFGKLMFLSLVLLTITSIGFGQNQNVSDAKNIYDNAEYGIKFVIPEGFNLYTAQNPGPLASLFDEKTIVFLVNTNVRDENISIQVTPGVTEGDLKKFKDISEESSLDVPAYEKVSVKFTNIGKKSDKLAVEHIFHMQGNVAGTLKQITFIHKNNGFTVTCGTARERYEEGSKKSFNQLFSNMEFY